MFRIRSRFIMLVLVWVAVSCSLSLPVHAAHEITVGSVTMEAMPAPSASQIGQALSWYSSGTATLSYTVDPSVSGPGTYLLTAEVTDSPTVPQGSANWIQLDIQYSGTGAWHTLVNQSGVAQGAKTIVLVPVQNDPVSGSDTISFRATILVDGAVSANSYPFTILYSITGPY